MRSRLPLAAVAMATATLLGSSAATAACLTADTQANCALAGDVSSGAASQAELARSSTSAPSALAQVGDVLPRGRYSVVVNAEYYGLSPVADGWVYVRVGHDAFRVDWDTHQVLERVTDQAAANW